MPLHPRKALDEGGADVATLQLGVEGPADVQQGMDGSVGEHAREGKEDLLPAAHPGQPVMDQANLQRACSGAATAGTEWPSTFM